MSASVSVSDFMCGNIVCFNAVAHRCSEDPSVQVLNPDLNPVRPSARGQRPQYIGAAELELAIHINLKRTLCHPHRVIHTKVYPYPPPSMSSLTTTLCHPLPFHPYRAQPVIYVIHSRFEPYSLREREWGTHLHPKPQKSVRTFSQ